MTIDGAVNIYSDLGIIPNDSLKYKWEIDFNERAAASTSGSGGLVVYGGLALLATGLFLGGRMIKKSFRKV